MLTEDYRVHLDGFEGPLDLLLFLIRKNEVDIHDIPIATITEQYLGFLRSIEGGLGRIDIDTAGEFLVTAATLMEIKSRMLSPAPAAATPDGAAPEEDPRADLVRQLLAYKKYRDAAEALEKRAEEWRRRFPAGAAGLDEDRLREAIDTASESVEADDLDLLDLVEAFQRVSETVNFDRLGEHHVQYDDTPVELHAEDIVDQLRRQGDLDAESPGKAAGEMTFTSIFRGRTKGEMVGLFLALLQLVRLRRVAIRQERVGVHADIYLSLRAEEA